MNDTNTTMIYLLSCAIHNQKPDSLPVKAVDWNTLYEDALAHQVHTLLFPLLSHIPPECAMNSTLLAHWHREVLLSAGVQVGHLKQMGEVLYRFHVEELPVVALKGLILRNYYPQPDLRTMSDADLLIHKKDLLRAKKLLRSMGYSIHETTFRHISFCHMDFPPIELHWALNDKESLEESSTFTNSIWDYTNEIKICGAPVQVLSAEDQFLHLLFHAMHHILSTGFGLRQLCDFVLFLEANNSNISWNNVMVRTASYGIRNFASAILILCRNLFHLEIPGCFQEPVQDEYVELLEKDILNAGVYGRKTKDRENSDRFRKYMDGKDGSGSLTRFSNFFKFLFPSAEKLDYHYSYAKKLPFLLPAAWIHRAVHNRKRMESLQISKEMEAAGRERAKLLQWLQLR